MKNNIFYLNFSENYFKKGDVLIAESTYKYKIEVLQDPHKKWWKQLFQYITFGFYKAPIQYKCKLAKNE